MWIRSLIVAVVFLLIGCGGSYDRFQNSGADSDLSRKDCWTDGNASTSLQIMRKAMMAHIEPELERDNYIQTFGCAYEEVEIEKNSIQAVHRAILQSLHNRRVEVRDNLLSLLESRPPRPDNLTREYTIYVNLNSPNSPTKVASYQVKILDLEVVHTIESPVTIWTRVATRFMHPEDHYQALPISTEKSRFVNVIEKAQEILDLAERGKIQQVYQILKQNAKSAQIQQPRSLSELSFADTFYLIDEFNPDKKYPAVFLGKGIVAGQTPKHGAIVFKFGEERLYGLRLDLRKFERLTGEFIEYNYQAPETILQCLFIKTSRNKPAALPLLNYRQ